MTEDYIRARERLILPPAAYSTMYSTAYKTIKLWYSFLKKIARLLYMNDDYTRAHELLMFSPAAI